MWQEFTLKNWNLVSLFGRQLFSIIFILSSASHFKPPTVEYAAQHGVPSPELLVPLSGIVALVGGLSVLLGYRTRIGAGLLALFLIPVTLMMHNFWAAQDAASFQIERALFLRNVCAARRRTSHGLLWWRALEPGFPDYTARKEVGAAPGSGSHHRSRS
jgi:putative oxidoreductase